MAVTSSPFGPGFFGGCSAFPPFGAFPPQGRVESGRLSEEIG